MDAVLQIFFIAAVLFFLAITVHYLSKRRLNLKYSLTWLGACIVMLILALFPGLVGRIGLLVGIKTVTSTVFVFAGMFMLVIIFTLTMIVSHMNRRICRLTQTLALLEKRVRELEAGSKKQEAGDMDTEVHDR